MLRTRIVSVKELPGAKEEWDDAMRGDEADLCGETGAGSVEWSVASADEATARSRW